MSKLFNRSPRFVDDPRQFASSRDTGAASGTVTAITGFPGRGVKRSGNRRVAVFLTGTGSNLVAAAGSAAARLVAMKRGGPLPRRTPLGPGKKAFERGSTFKSERKPLAKVSAKQRKKKAGNRDRDLERAWVEGIRAMSCAVCGAEEGECGPIVGHHIIEQQYLEKKAAELGIDFLEIRWDLRNRLNTGVACHQAHHSASRRIKRSVLVKHAPGVFDFAEQYGLTSRLDRTYPEVVDV